MQGPSIALALLQSLLQGMHVTERVLQQALLYVEVLLPS